LWPFTVNAGETFVLTLNNGTSSVSGQSYYVSNVCLSHSIFVSYLLITMDRRHIFQNHINNMVSKSMQCCGILFPGFLSCDLSLMQKAFITYIRPVLEHSSCTWSPSNKMLIYLLGNFHRRFSKRIPSISSLSYLECQAALDLDILELLLQLELGCRCFDLLSYYTKLNNLSPLAWKHYFKFNMPPSPSGIPLPIYKSLLRVLQNSFPHSLHGQLIVAMVYLYL
jgi:hypothetical protein